MSKARDAAKAFRENLTFVKSKTDPVMWNLCKGLENLALAVAELESKIDQVERDTHIIKGSIR